MAHYYDPLIKNLQKVTHLNSNSLFEHYNDYVRRYPQDNEGFGLLLHVMKHQDDKSAKFMLIRHLKEYHHLDE